MTETFFVSEQLKEQPTLTMLKAAFLALEQGVLIFNQSLQLVAWNDSYNQMAISPSEYLRAGTELFTFYTEFAKAGAFAADDPKSRIESVYQTDSYKFELMAIASSGKSIRINQSRLPEEYLLITFTDVTNEVRLETQLRQTQKMNSVGKLTGGVAHDVNNVLAVVTGNLELAIEEIQEPSVISLLNTALRASERGGKLTHQLLAFARQQELRPDLVQPQRLLQQLLDMLQKTLGQGIELELVNNGNWQWCEVDKHQLETVIVNLVINAKDAMPKGGKITIGTAALKVDEMNTKQLRMDAGEYICLFVQDTGLGIAPDYINHIFEPFFTTKEMGQGTGLGLSMVYGFVKQSGGYIKVESEVGIGTSVKVFLPKKDHDKEQTEELRNSVMDVQRGVETILVVEDEVDLKNTLVTQLTSLGYDVLSADDGHSGLELFKQGIKIDLLLTDLVLPKQMSGKDLAEAALSINANLPIVFMSGYTDNAAIYDGSFNENITLLNKPFRKIELAQAVRSALN